MSKPHHKIKPAYTVTPPKSPYGKYKQDLERDFNKRCGYCDSPAHHWGGRVVFQIDHFAPKSKFKHLKDKYENLIYSCPICNRGKSNLWASDDENVSIVDGEGFLHPCLDDYSPHFRRLPTGQIEPLTHTGKYMYKKLKFYLRRHEIIWLMEELRELINEVRPFVKNPKCSKSRRLKSYCQDVYEAYFDYEQFFIDSIDER